jgi:hypothetical protein
MAEQFGPGYDRNHDGRPDLPNSYEYVNPGRYEVRLAAAVDAIGVSAENVSCAWTIDGHDGAISVRATGLRPIVRLPQGAYAVKASAQLADGRSGSASETIHVRDLLIAVMGDSQATGEGNSEEPARWEEAGVPAGGWSCRSPRVPARLIGFSLLGALSVYASGRLARRRSATGNEKRKAVWAQLTVLGVVAGVLFETLVGFGWAFRGRLDPPTPARWADGGPGGDKPRLTPAGILPPSSVLHVRAHRSTRSAPAQFAMRLEADDPHTSVTFVCLAGTGARTVDLFVPDRSGQNRALGPGPVLPAQFDELRAIVGSRPVDILVLSIGFNDCRSVEILGDLIRREIRCVDPLRLLAAYPTRQAWAAARAPDIAALVEPTELVRLQRLDPEVGRKEPTKDARLVYDVDEAAAAGLAAARDQLARLSRSIAQEPLLNRAEVFLLEYPDPTRDSNGATGNAILDDLVPGLRINRRELDLVRERLLRPLNQTCREVADGQGWTYVGGIFSSFQRHGYTASDTWFIRAKESEQLQGPRLWLVGYLRGEFSPGMLHPNRRGHRVIADHLYRSLVAKIMPFDERSAD